MFNSMHADWRSSGGVSASAGAAFWSGDHLLRPGTSYSLAKEAADLYRPTLERRMAYSMSPLRPHPTASYVRSPRPATTMGMPPEPTWRTALLSKALPTSPPTSPLAESSDVHKQYHVGGALAIPAAGVRCACSSPSSTSWTVQTGKPPGGRGNAESYRYL